MSKGTYVTARTKCEVNLLVKEKRKENEEVST